MEKKQTGEEEDERRLDFTVDSLEDLFTNWQEMAATAGAVSASLTMTGKKGFCHGLALQKPKAKWRNKTDCGGRIVRATGRKDRHSKVCTAKGTRDRRVRLSPETAIQFYDVLDRLGYDRPSKAIDWLMTEAKVAIDALDNEPPTSDCNLFGSEYCIGPGNHDSFAFIQQQLSASSDGMFDKNLDSGKMQRILAWNYGNGSAPDIFAWPEHSVWGRGQISREPLQSSYSRIVDCNHPMSTRFSSFDFSDDLLQDVATPGENEAHNIYKIPVSGEQSSSTCFLHCEE